MELCDYWWQSDETEQCDLINGKCACGGSNGLCSIKGSSIADVIKQEEKITLKEASINAQRRRHGLREAS